MINFNELRISECDKKLVIDISVSPLSYYTDVYIDKIIIDTQDTYIGTGPSANPIYQYIVPETSEQAFEKQDVIGAVLAGGTDNPVYSTYYGNIKSLRLEIPELLLAPFDSTMLFVYVLVKGAPASETPCGMDNIYTLGVTTDLTKFYIKSMNFLKEIDNNCNISNGLIDFILKMNGLDIALKTCNYPLAIKYWNKFFKGSYFTSLTNNCGCNG